jgi:putative ABC transport system substrate-binding protein
MRRRELILGLAGAAVVAPLTARAQQSPVPVIGFLNSGSPEQYEQRLAAYFKGLAGGGFVEGHNVAVDYRWAMGDNDRIPALAAELVQRKVAVIVALASTVAAHAAQAATSTIPIVFGTGADPVRLGLVASLSRPAGNITGVTSQNVELASKRLGLFRELVPQAARHFGLINPTSPLAQPFVEDLQFGAAAMGLRCDILRAESDAEIDTAFVTVAAQPGSVLIVSSDAFFYIRRTKLAALALQHAIPTLFDVHEYVEVGGLMSYGSDFLDVLQFAGAYTARILNGQKPADLPVAQSTRFELAINLKTAKALGLTVPPILLAQADDVIE